MNLEMRRRCHSLMEKFGIPPSFHAESLFILRSLMNFFPFEEDLTHQRPGWRKTHERLHQDRCPSSAASQFQNPDSRHAFRPWLKLCSLFLGCCLFLQWVNSTAYEELGRGRRNNKGWNGLGWNRTGSFPWPVSISVPVWAHHPSGWLYIDPWVERWLHELEIRFYYGDRQRACQLWHHKGTRAGLGSEERCSHYNPNMFYKSLWQAHAPE